MKANALPHYAKVASVLIILISLGYVAVLGKDVLAPLVFSFLFAMLLLPLSRFLEHKCRLPRAVAAMLSVILFTAFVALIIFILAIQAGALSDDWPQIRTQISHSIDELHRWTVNKFHFQWNAQMLALTKQLNAQAAPVIGTTLVGVTSMVLFLVFIFIDTFFILFYRKVLISFLLKVFSDDREVLVFDVAEQIQFIMKKYISGLFLEMLCVFAIVFGLLSLIGVKYALLLGLVTAIFNLIPYVGIFSATAISALLTLGTLTPGKALEVAVSIIAVHLIDSNIIMPRIVGSKVKLNALVVVLGVVVGEMLWGLSGMFLAIPVLAIVKIVFDRVTDLKPWGLLLGDTTEYQEALVERVAKKSDTPKEAAKKAKDDLLTDKD
ncbi:AI-2E family transporter [Mucilaginibacter sp. PPCGB 2223]|uniref:AI-2E family transporter n=1 Tax=Mucilaginibacter sp. PPCGB 2223 TaxID=1886027 RepID=UPI0008266072|nr:AI-2E family transporter [Mucilaginibacter sp. PPCGB 2223]OCX51019.1 AI-2E family transporter [Mucilaginibacter sp. PPCGB 2223]